MSNGLEEFSELPKASGMRNKRENGKNYLKRIKLYLNLVRNHSKL